MFFLQMSVLLSIIGFYYNLGIINYNVFGNNELRLYDLGMLYPVLTFIFSLIKRYDYSYTKKEKYFGYFVAYCFASMILFTTFMNILNLEIIAIAHTVLYFYHLLGFYVISIYALRIFEKRMLFKLILILTYINAIVLLLQHINIIDHFWSHVYINSYGDVNFSAFLGPNRITPSMTMFFSSVFLLIYGKKYDLQLVSNSCILICIINILMIGSRTTLLALFIFFIYIILNNQMKQFIIPIIITVLLAINFSPIKDRIDYIVYNRISKKIVEYDNDTVEARFNRITSRRVLTNLNYIEKIQNEPWTLFFGRGFNNRYIAGAKSAHNQYISLLFELGFVGLFLFVRWLYSIYVIHYFNNNNQNKIFYKAFVLSMIITLTGGEHLYIYRPLFALLGLFLLIINFNDKQIKIIN